jgi:hypothetical protein
MFRSRRRWRLAGAGLVVGLVGVFMFSYPALSNGQWSAMLPRAVQVRLWPNFGTQWMMRTWSDQVKAGMITSKDAGPFVAAAHRGLAISGGPLRAECLSLLTALKIHDDESMAAAIAELKSTSWPGRQAAIKHLQMAEPEMAKLVAIVRTAYTPPLGLTDAHEVFEVFEPLIATDSNVRALMLDIAMDRSNPLSSSAQNYIHRARTDKATLREDVITRMLASKDPLQQDYIVQNFLPYTGQAQTKRDGDLLRWALARYLTSPDNAQEMGMLYQAKDVRPLADDLEAALAAGQIDENSSLWQVIARLPTAPPSAFAAALKTLTSEPGMLHHEQVMILTKPGRDRLPSLLELEHHADWRVRRAVCSIFASLTPRSEEAIEALRRMESDRKEPEEVHVAARDALRRMGLWPDEGAKNPESGVP